MEHLLSIITPVYKVENFIEKCAHSLMKQTIRGIQFVFIDDRGNDESISLLRRVISLYPERTKDVLILENPKNLGSSESRNKGLRHANGKYVTFCDADDWVDPTAAQVMLENIVKLDADIVWTDFYLVNRHSEMIQNQRCFETSEACVSALLEERLHGALWNKIYRKDLFDSNNIIFPSGRDVWEDLYTNVRLFYFAKKVAYVPNAFYHYVQYNNLSLASIRNEKQLSDIIANTESIIDFLKDQSALDRFEDQVQMLKLASKQTLLFSVCRSSFRKWRELFPESNDEIWNFKKLPIHLRLLGKMASFKLWPIIDFWILLKRIKNVFNKS